MIGRAFFTASSYYFSLQHCGCPSFLSLVDNSTWGPHVDGNKIICSCRLYPHRPWFRLLHSLDSLFSFSFLFLWLVPHNGLLYSFLDFSYFSFCFWSLQFTCIPSIAFDHFILFSWLGFPFPFFYSFIFLKFIVFFLRNLQTLKYQYYQKTLGNNKIMGLTNTS